MMHRTRFTWAVLVLIVPSAALLAGQTQAGTAFTYQGQLKQNGQLGNGSFDLQFRLFDAAVDGNPIGSPVTLASVAVANGLFTVQLNAGGEFGPNAFNGARRWLEIAVNGMTLTPRQELTAAPYALYAAGPWAAGEDGNLTYSGGNIGIGTPSPGYRLDVRGGDTFLGEDLYIGTNPPRLALGASASNYGSLGFNFTFTDTSDEHHYARADFASRLEFGFGGFKFFTAPSGSVGQTVPWTERLSILNNGNVGIGTTTPNAALQVVDERPVTSFLGNHNEGLRVQGPDVINSYSLIGFDHGNHGENLSQIGAYFTGGGTFLTFGTSSDYSAGITNQALTIDPYGRVGIGSSAPSYLLHVNASTPGNPVAVFQQGDSSGYGVSITVTNEAAPFYALRISNRDNSIDRDLFRGDGSAFLALGGGNVGIGTTTPATKLHVGGSVRTDGDLSFATNVSPIIRNDAGGQLRLISSAGITLNETGGNVGIGTTTPAATLDVNGTARTSAFQLTTAPQGGFVLTSDDVGNASWQRSWSALWQSMGNNIYNTNPGNVGIGTPSPQATLDVNGTVHASRLTANVGSDLPCVEVFNIGNGDGLRADGASRGVYGVGAYGVYGSGGTGAYGTGTLYGVQGQSGNTGVYGSGTNGYGVRGTSSNVAVRAEGGNYGLWASGAAYAGYFFGNVLVQGNFNVQGAKAFQIDHPLDPERMYLFHYCTEGPEPQNAYNGVVALDQDGQAWVDLPDYFEEINKDFRYQLTCIGGFAPVYIAHEIERNRFQIAGGTPGLKVSWEVKGVRNDRYARVHGAPVEQDKSPENRGKYLQPELYGQPKERGQFYRPEPPPGQVGESPSGPD